MYDARGLITAAADALQQYGTLNGARAFTARRDIEARAKKVGLSMDEVVAGARHMVSERQRLDSAFRAAILNGCTLSEARRIADQTDARKSR